MATDAVERVTRSAEELALLGDIVDHPCDDIRLEATFG